MLVLYLTSEIGTTSLQKTIANKNFYLRDRDDLSTRVKIDGPIVSLVRRFHCIIQLVESGIVVIPVNRLLGVSTVPYV